MKKHYISLIVIFIVIVTLGFVWYFISSHHTVVFSLTGGKYDVNIFREGEKNSLATLKSSDSLLLKSGDYHYVVNSDDYDNTAVNFNVDNKDVDIKIYPDYSDSHLRSLLTNNERKTIIDTLTPYLNKVKSTDYSLRSLDLYQRGQWAAGTISYQPSVQEPAEIYRFILSKDKTWKVVVPPMIAIYRGDYPNIPVTVINKLYNSNS